MLFAALHPQSQIFIASWRAINGLESEKANHQARNAGASNLVDRLFMAQKLDDGAFVFRTIGKELSVWTGRDLKDHEISSIFRGADKKMIESLLEAVATAPGPALARLSCFGLSFGQRAEVELVFVPLMENGRCMRVLGLFQPLAANSNISHPVLRFAISAVIPPEPTEPKRPNLRIVSKNGQ